MCEHISPGSTLDVKRPIGIGMRGLAGWLALLALGAVLAGCFDAPRLEDLWTRVDIDSANLNPYEALTLGVRESVEVHTTVTYREVVTGYAVAEMRVSPTITAGTLPISPDASRLPMAQAIDSLLQHSVSIGRALVPVTGWGHVVQRIDFAFGAGVPAVLDTTGAGAGGLFLVCYLGSGVIVNRPGLADTVVVTPLGSAQYQMLPIGMSLTAVAGPGAR
jgi:hypothetical protein